MPCRAFEGMHHRYNDRGKKAAIPSALVPGTPTAPAGAVAGGAPASPSQQQPTQQEAEGEQERARRGRSTHHILRPTFWSDKVSAIHLYQSMAFYVIRAALRGETPFEPDPISRWRCRSKMQTPALCLPHPDLLILTRSLLCVTHRSAPPMRRHRSSRACGAARAGLQTPRPASIRAPTASASSRRSPPPPPRRRHHRCRRAARRARTRSSAPHARPASGATTRRQAAASAASRAATTVRAAVRARGGESTRNRTCDPVESGRAGQRI